jgi:hypothetical protein
MRFESNFSINRMLVSLGGSQLGFYGDRLLEDGAFRLLEDGGLRVLESGSFATGSMLLEDGFFVLLEDGSQVLFG